MTDEVASRVQTLILALADDHVSVRWNAARELARIGTAASAALPALTALMKDLDATSALWARYAVACITGDARKHVPVFIEALGDRRVWPGMAAFALAGLGAEAEAAAPALILQLRDPHPDNRWSAAGALAAIGPGAEDAAPGLIEALADTDEKVRWYAAWALSEIGPRAAAVVEALSAALSDIDDDVIGYAARALGRIGAAARSAIPQLEALANCENEAVRAEVRQALERIAGSEGIRPN